MIMIYYWLYHRSGAPNGSFRWNIYSKSFEWYLIMLANQKARGIGYDIPMGLSHGCSGIILTAPLNEFHIWRSFDGKTPRLQFKDRDPPSLPLRYVFGVPAPPATLRVVHDYVTPECCSPNNDGRHNI